MKKYSLIIGLLSVGLNVLLIGFLVFNIVHKKAPQSTISPEQQNQTPLRIAILTPVTHPSLEQIQKGFQETLRKTGKATYACTVFNANGDRVLMRAMADEIMRGDFDLIFSITTKASQLIKELSSKRHKNVPIVFSAVSRPVEVGLVQSLHAPGGRVTGVVEYPGYEKQLSFLHMLKPSTKSVLLIYDPTQNAGLEEDKAQVEQILLQHGITLSCIQVYNTSEIYQKAQSAIDNTDVVMVLKDNTVVSGIDGLIKLCNLHNVTLLTTDLDSSDKGAALSFGVYEYDFGTQGAMLARKILEEGADPATLPCVNADDFHLKINSKTMAQQGLEIPSEQLLLFKSIIVA